MALFKKILFPVDLSEVSPKLIPVVQEMAAKFSAEVHVLFVARGLGHMENFYVPHANLAVFEKEYREGAQRRLVEFTKAQFTGEAGMKEMVVTGDPAEEIINYAKANGIDLIIMGTHGRKGLEKAIFGSVAQRVSQTSPMPVLTVNPYLS